jgi:hypothetical protein
MAELFSRTVGRSIAFLLLREIEIIDRNAVLLE